MTTKADIFFRKNPTGENIFQTTKLNYSGSSYGECYAGMTYLYGYDCDGNRFDYFVTNHRAKTIISLINDNKWWGLDSSIRDNYSTNGYTTRVGINRANMKRCKQLSESHKKFPYSGKNAHDYRVLIRN